MRISEIFEAAPNGVVLFDGGMGSMIQQRGLARPGQLADLLALDAPDGIAAIHAAYVQAGADVITTNTFNANARNVASAVKAPGANPASVADVYAAAARCARAAGARWVAADIGPLGELIEPYGDLEEDEAAALFGEQAAAARDAGADLIIIETMADLNEATLALRAAKATGLPVISTMSFQAGGFTMFGVTPEAAVEALSAEGADAIGMNCSTGPEDMVPLAQRMVACAKVPVIVQPNAGLPRVDADGATVYDMQPDAFAECVAQMVQSGVRIIGGCCGTTPDFTRALDVMRRQI